MEDEIRKRFEAFYDYEAGAISRSDKMQARVIEAKIVSK